MKSILLLFGLVSIHLYASGTEAPHITREEYIEAWKDEAIYQMALHKIPASITLAQGILESGDGNSRLATAANNHFGIKCHTDWTGAKIFEDDDAKSECFRKYDDARASYEDHSLFLQRKRYESLFELDTDDYKAWAKGLKNCGYATNPKYPELLIKLIEEFELHAYDKEGMKHIKNKTLPDRKSGRPIANTKPTPKEEKKDKKRGAKNKSSDTPREITLSNRSIEFSDNRIKFIRAKAGDTPEKIADDLGLNPWQIKKYNDLESLQTTFKQGDKIYIQPKRNHGAHATYTVQKQDNLHAISQQVGVKIKSLKKLNPSINWQDIPVGATLKLRK